MKNYKFYEQVNHNFDKAAPFTRFDKGILNQIKVCNTVYKVVFPIKRDDGSIQVIEGWRVEHRKLQVWTPHADIEPGATGIGGSRL